MDTLVDEINIYKSPVGFDVPHLEVGLRRMPQLAKECSALHRVLDTALGQKSYKSAKHLIENTLAELASASALLQSYEREWKTTLEIARHRKNPTAIFVDVGEYTTYQHIDLN
jgi:hypothetical protein